MSGDSVWIVLRIRDRFDKAVRDIKRGTAQVADGDITRRLFTEIILLVVIAGGLGDLAYWWMS